MTRKKKAMDWELIILDNKSDDVLLSCSVNRSDFFFFFGAYGGGGITEANSSLLNLIGRSLMNAVMVGMEFQETKY